MMLALLLAISYLAPEETTLAGEVSDAKGNGYKINVTISYDKVADDHIICRITNHAPARLSLHKTNRYWNAGMRLRLVIEGDIALPEPSLSTIGFVLGEGRSVVIDLPGKPKKATGRLKVYVGDELIAATRAVGYKVEK